MTFKRLKKGYGPGSSFKFSKEATSTLLFWAAFVHCYRHTLAQQRPIYMATFPFASRTLLHSTHLPLSCNHRLHRLPTPSGNSSKRHLYLWPARPMCWHHILPRVMNPLKSRGWSRILVVPKTLSYRFVPGSRSLSGWFKKWVGTEVKTALRRRPFPNFRSTFLVHHPQCACAQNVCGTIVSTLFPPHQSAEIGVVHRWRFWECRRVEASREGWWRPEVVVAASVRSGVTLSRRTC